MKELVGKTRLGFQRMAESVPEIEQRARAGRFALVLGNDPRLGSDAARNRFLERLALEGENAIGAIFEPFEEIPVAQHTVFQHLGIAGAQLARGQGGERIEIGQHQRGLVEGADEVLARTGIDCGLAADRTVNLREQCGGQLHEAAAALEDRAGETGEVADDPSAQGKHMVAALDALSEHPVGELRQALPALRRLARGHIEPARLHSCILQRAGDRLAPALARIFVGDDADVALADEGGSLPGDIVEQARPHAHFVFAPCQFDVDYSHASIASRMALAVSACGPSSVTTWICASA